MREALRADGVVAARAAAAAVRRWRCRGRMNFRCAPFLGAFCVEGAISNVFTESRGRRVGTANQFVSDRGSRAWGSGEWRVVLNSSSKNYRIL